jgi:hypothetical protein
MSPVDMLDERDDSLFSFGRVDFFVFGSVEISLLSLVVRVIFYRGQCIARSGDCMLGTFWCDSVLYTMRIYMHL